MLERNVVASSMKSAGKDASTRATLIDEGKRIKLALAAQEA